MHSEEGLPETFRTVAIRLPWLAAAPGAVGALIQLLRVLDQHADTDIC